MAEAVGLSIGATRFAGVQLGRPPVTRQSVLTLYAQRSPELGVPGENPNLTQPGMVVTEFVDRVGDPVGMVAADGSMHRGELLVADALRELLYTVTGGRPPAAPPTVTYPAHWRKAQVDALRTALTHVPEWSRRGQPTLVCDAAAAISALQSDPGVPARGVIALCDFGGTGTSITLLDAGRGYAPVGPTVRHTDFSGDLIDQALLTHVAADLSGAVPGLTSSEATGTSALGPLHRLRGQCRGAKERLSAGTVTALSAELPGFSGDVRLTRAELEDQIRRPLTDFLRVFRDTIDRSGVRAFDVVAVALGRRWRAIPLVTATLSEWFRVPVITTRHPELAAAGGASRRRSHLRRSGARRPRPSRRSPLRRRRRRVHTFRALAWSEAHDVPPLAPAVEPLTSPRWTPRRRVCRAPARRGVRRRRRAVVARHAVVPGAGRRFSVSPHLFCCCSAPARSWRSAATAPLRRAPRRSPRQPRRRRRRGRRTAGRKPCAGTAAGPGAAHVLRRPGAGDAVSSHATGRPTTAAGARAGPAAPQAPTPSSESPPPPPPPETTTVTATTQAPPSTTTVTAPPPSPQPSEPTQAPAPTSTQPPVTFTLRRCRHPRPLNPQGNR